MAVRFVAGTSRRPAEYAAQPALGPARGGNRTGVIANAAARRDAEVAVTAGGRRVGRDLSIINGLTAVITADAVAAIGQSPSVIAITADAPLAALRDDGQGILDGARAPARQRVPKNV